MATTSPPDKPPEQPNFDIVDARIEKALHTRDLAHGGGGGNIGGMAHEERLAKLEVDVGTIKGSLDWAKIVVSIVSAVFLAGFAILISMVLNLGGKVDTQSANLASKIDAISTAVTDELRAQRADQAAQTSAVANAITAAKQQPPVVLLQPVPAEPSGANGTPAP